MAKWVPWVGLWYDDVWNDISTHVYDRDDIMIRRGKTNESSEPVPTAISMTLKNRDQRYTPDNPTSPLYGKVGRNTLIQVCSDPPVLEDFEDASFQLTFTAAGVGSWARSSTRAKRDTWSYKSATISDGQLSGTRITAPAGATSISFWMWVSISGSSFASIYTSEGLQWYDNGETAEWRLITVDLGTSNWVQIEYQRSTSGGSNAIWIDDVRAFDARGTGEVWDWSPASTIDFDPATPDARGDAWCNIQAGGLLRRIGQASDDTESPIRRAVLRGTMKPVAYWPMEDPEGVSGAAEAFGGAPMKPITQVRYTLPDGTPVVPGGLPKFQNDGGVPGSAPLAGFVDGGTLRGVVPTIPAGEYGIDIVVRFKPGADEGGTASADIFSWRESGTYVAFTINVSAGNVTVFHANAADLALVAFTGSVSAGVNVFDGAPHHIRYQVAQGGPDYEAMLYVDGFFYGYAENFATPGSMAGAVGRPVTVEWNPLEDRGEYMPAAAGHVMVWPIAFGIPDTYTPTFGYPAEQAGIRLLRFADEEGWAVTLRNRNVATAKMGPQTVAPMPSLLKDIERTEDGILFDQRGASALVLRTRVSQYAKASRLDLTYGTDALAPMQPVYDDQRLMNHVTAKNRDGQQYEALKTTGRLGAVNPLSGGAGRYPWTADVNTGEGPARLAQIAWWWANKGTIEGARYPTLVIDLDADPSLETAVASLDMGDRVRVNSLGNDAVDLRVLGIAERYGHRRRLVTLLCEPYRQFDVAIYDDPVKRYDSRTSTLNAGYSNTATTMVVTFTDPRDAWSTTNEPYDWVVAGERIRVTSMGTVSGSGPYTQSASVSRSINGVVRSQTAGSPVHIHPEQLSRYAL